MQETLRVMLTDIKWNTQEGYQEGDAVGDWCLIPPSHAQVIPDYIPQAVRDDYYEACLIVQLSPKAAATLSRRCLQGILRDYWGVKPRLLVDEIEEIKDKVDPLTWEAIEAVRKVGKIGAYLEKDINVIVEVDSGEAELLSGLIETLVRDWYIAREERKLRLSQISLLAQTKKRRERTVGEPPGRRRWPSRDGGRT